MVKMAIDLWIREQVAKLAVILLAIVLVNSVYQAMASEKHDCDYCVTTTMEVSK